jgi:hypothetical protein
MIVRNDDRRGIALQRHLDDFPQMHAGAVDGAAKQFLKLNQDGACRDTDNYLLDNDLTITP